MAWKIGSFFATLGIDASRYTRGILEAQAVTTTFGATFTSFITNPVLGAVGLFGRLAAGAVDMSRDVLASAESITRLSAATGQSVETIQTLRAVLTEAGLGAAEADATLLTFATRLGDIAVNGDAAQQVFSKLGVSLVGISDADQALRLALDTLSAMPDEAQRTAASMDLFGRSGRQTFAAIGGGSAALDAATEKFRRLGQVIDSQSVASLAKLEDNVDTISAGFDGLARTAVAQFLVGLSGQVSTADASIVDIVSTIRDRLGPASRDAGESIGRIVGNLDKLLERLDRVANFAELNIEGLQYLFEERPDAAMMRMRGEAEAVRRLRGRR